MEPQIIIPLSEYNKLKELQANLSEYLDKNKTLVFHDSQFPGHSGYQIHKYTVVTNDVFCMQLQAKIDEQEMIIREQGLVIGTQVNNQKKWWQM